ncbi:HAT protein [Hirschfeldia incana]|nr:HAT protein [Hirschfeldia incana]
MIINEMDLSDAVIVKSSKLKSAVWNDFDKVRKGEIHVAICRHCKKRLSGSSASGTSHLRNHLIRCKRRASCNGVGVTPPGKKRVELAIVDPTKHEHDASVVNSGLDQRRSRFDLARMIILHGYPLTMVEDVGFRVFLRNLQPLFEPVVFERVESDCMEIYAKEKHKIFEDLDKLPGKISVSVDVWNGGGSDDCDEFLCLAAHYIDETWEVRKRVLNFFMVDPSHTDVMLAEVVITCLMEWDIDRKLFSMASNRTPPFGEEVANKIRDRLSQNKFLYCNGQLFDVSCGVYVVNQMAQESLEACFETINKIRESIRYVKSSEFIQESFNQWGGSSERDLCIDDSTRWDTTCAMLEIALELKNVFSLMKQRDPHSSLPCPSGLEWARLETVVGFLKVFVEVTNTFTKGSSSNCLTANIYFPEICDIHLRLIECSKSPDGFISSLAVTMRKRFEEFWNRNHRVLAIATILDARFKMKLVEYYYPLFYDSTASEFIQDISEYIKALYNEHSVGSLLASSEQSLVWQENHQHPHPHHQHEDRLIEFDKYINATTTSPGQDSKSDLEKYLEEPLFPRNSDLDILNWWKVHTPKYPILSMVARNVLAVPMSNLSSEEDPFESSRKRRISETWCSLRPSTVQALMCAQDWIRSELESS